MDPIALQDLVQAVNGTLLSENIPEGLQITGAEYDTRKIRGGDVFFAFKGENSDGHRYVPKALEEGAAGAVVSEKPESPVPGKFYVLVEDTIKAFGDLARWYRSQFSIPVVGVTGSVGKTTTKDMIASVLSEKFETVKTEGNFNNHIGLPYTVLHLSHTTQAAVIEMGMNHLGEIDYLVHIAQPTIAVITNIGEAHIGILGSRENIFRAKSEIFSGLAAGGTAILNGDDDYQPMLKDDAKAGKIFDGKNPAKGFHLIFQGEGENCDYRAVDIRDDLEHEVTFTGKTPKGDIAFTVPALGRHMIYPVLTACAVGHLVGETNEEIRNGVLHYVPTKMRMETLHLPGNILVYNDTYNANPQSMKSGLHTLARTKGYRHVAVVGDMFELGDMTEELHRGIGSYVAELNRDPEHRIDALITVGEAAAFIAKEAKAQGVPDVFCCNDKEEAKVVLDDQIRKDTAFLVKASRGMALEELTKYIGETAEKE